MAQIKFRCLPAHIGVIPDGNRRWAQKRGLPKEAGYEVGVECGFRLYEVCLELGIKEMTFYGFTMDNTKRPPVQKKAFKKACVDAVKILSNRDASLLVIGNPASPNFPRELLPYTKRVTFGRDLIRINFLVNYDWKWDLSHAVGAEGNFVESIASAEIPRVDLLIRWGGRRRLSGFLPVQSVYADMYVLDELWPDFEPEQFYRALKWYEAQDITLGG